MKKTLPAVLLILLLSGTSILFAQAPLLSYPSQQPYSAGVPITTLTPTNTGGAIPGVYYGQPTVFGNYYASSSGAYVSSMVIDINHNVTYGINANAIVIINSSGGLSKFVGGANSGFANGAGSAASFYNPQGLVVDAAGNIYVADQNNNVIRKISPQGVVSTYAGTGKTGAVLNGPAASATFNSPAALAIDNQGNIYVSDQGDALVRKITAAGVVSTLAGSGTAGYADGTGAAASFNVLRGIIVDPSGIVYVSDDGNERIRKITPAGVVTTLAGSGAYIYADGTGTAASFYGPCGLAFDALGNIYVADGNNSYIRKVTTAGVVTTLTPFNSPNALCNDAQGNLYAATGPYIYEIPTTGYTISQNLPAGLTFDPSTGNISGTPLLASPQTNYTITGYNTIGSSAAVLQLTVTGAITIPVPAVKPPNVSYQSPQNYGAGTTITTLSPSNSGGAVPGVYYGQTNTFAAVNGARGVAIDAAGNVYVSTGNANQVKKISPAGVIGVFAGTGTADAVNGSSATASFNGPQGIAIDAAGNLYIADAGNNLIRKINTSGVVSTLAGNGVSGFANGAGAAASFNNPIGLALDNFGNVYVADAGNNAIRIINPGGIVSTLAGGTPGAVNGTGTAASFASPSGIAVDAAGNVYVADEANNLVRKINPAGVVTTLAGGATGVAVNGTGTAASFYNPASVALDALGNVYVADEYNYLIRKITPAGVVSTVAGNSNLSEGDGNGTSAGFGSPNYMAYDGAGNVYLSDESSYVRKVSVVGYRVSPVLPVGLTFDPTTGNIAGTPTVAATTADTVYAYNIGGSNFATLKITVTGTAAAPALVKPPVIAYAGQQTYTSGTAITHLAPSNTGGAVPATLYGQTTTFAGNGATGRNDGPAASATFNEPGASVVDAFGNLYVFDQNNYLIRKISPSGNVSTLAGGSYGAVNGTGTAASFSNVAALAIDASGNIYAADVGNQLIREITPLGVVTTLAGSGATGYLNATGIKAKFYNPTGVALDGLGNLYVADQENYVIRKIVLATGAVTTFAGSSYGNHNSTTLTNALFSAPTGLAIDPSGNIYVTEPSINDIRKITAAGVTTFAGSTTGQAGFADGIGNAATFNGVSQITADMAGNLYVLDVTNNLVRKITGAGVVSTIAGNSTAGFANNIGTAATFNGMDGIAADGSGNLYVSEMTNNVVRKITATGFVSGNGLPAGLSFDGTTGTISGTPTDPVAAATYTVSAFNGGGSATATVGITITGTVVKPVLANPPAISYSSPQSYTAGSAITPLLPTNTGGAVPAQIYAKVNTLALSSPITPYALAVDPTGNLYAATTNMVYKISATGVAGTFVGSGQAGAVNATGTAASFNLNNIEVGMAFDAQGNLYIADNGNNLIRKVSPSGVVSTYAGTGKAGSVNGPAASATFNNPIGIAVDLSGNVYVADAGNYLVREITPAGVVSTLAGNIGSGGTSSDGTGTAASFASPGSLTVDASGNIYITDGNEIRKIAPGGVVTTLAGNGVQGETDGTGNGATFSNPYQLTVDALGNIYATDTYTIRKITPGGVVTTIAGSYTNSSSEDGIGASAYMGLNVTGIAYDGQGNLYTADGGSIRKTSIVGYSLNTPLPPGLAFDATTGSINGTPVLAATAANYGVTAYNTGGSGQATVSITVGGTLPVITSTVSPPNISYTPSTNSYPAGTAISNLAPVNAGGAVPAMIYGKTVTLSGTTAISSPQGLAVDGSDNVYITAGTTIWLVNPAGVASILAGTGASGSANGQGTAASFSGANGIAVDAQGNKYIADSYNNMIRKISPSGVVSTLAGNGASGYIDGPGGMAEFNSPEGVAVDAYGNVYVADTYNNIIRRISPSGDVSTLAGTTNSGSANGTGTAASFSTPNNLAVDASGNIYVADASNYLVRKITPAGVVTTLAGGSTTPGANGLGVAANFTYMYGITVDMGGNVYVTNYNTVRKITPAGVVSTLAGTYGNSGSTDGVGTTASFSSGVYGLTVDPSGNVYVVDNSLIRKISAVGYSINSALPPGLSFDATTGTISGLPLLATTSPASYTVNAYNMGGFGTAPLTIGVTGTATVPALPALPAISYTTPDIYAVGQPITALQPANTGGVVPAANYGQTSTFAGSGMTGLTDGEATLADFNNPSGLATDVYGNVYVADQTNNVIRRVSPLGIVTTIAGNGVQGLANGTGTAASFDYPTAVAVDNAFNIYVADQYNYEIRKINSAGVVTTLAGNGKYGYTNTGAGEFSYLTGIAVDASGNVYVADQNNQRIRKITSAGVVSTLAGSGSATYKTNAAGTLASFNYPSSVAVDAAGNVYVADPGNYLVRKITSSTGIVSDLAGSRTSGSNDGTGTSASFSGTFFVTSVDAGGNVYVADAGNNLIRKISPAGVVTTIAGSGVAGLVNGIGGAASFSNPQSAAADNSGNLYIADGSNNVIRKVNISGYAINTFAPEGLSFNGTNGIISGTPTTSSPNTTYNVTAYNSAGPATANVNITVIYPPVVATSAAVTAFASMGDITPVPVIIDNALTVTDQSLATLASAKVSITGNFIAAQDVLGFTNVPASMGNIAGSYSGTTGILSLTSAGATATIAQWQAALGAVTYNNTNNVSPNVTNRTIAFVVNDGTFNSTAVAYKTIGLTYTPSHNDNLASLAVSAGTLAPVFSAATTSYSFGVNNAIASLTVNASTVSLNASVAINGATAQLAKTSATVPLIVGNNTIPVVVLAQDGVTTQTYTLNIIRAATQTITFAATNTVNYGAADFNPGATSTNSTIPITYTSSNPAVATIVAGNIHITGAGVTNITASQAGNINFNAATPVVQALTVNPAALTIAANNQTSTYGSSLPLLTASYTGFVNGDSQASLTTQPAITTTATASSPAAIYPITVSGAVDANYTIAYTAGTLTIGAATLTVTANNQTSTYGSSIPALTISYKGFVNGDTQASLSTQPTIGTTAIASSPAGAYPITAAGAIDQNYTINYTAGTLTIGLANLVITANNQTKVYGTVNPLLTATYAGFVNGDTQASLKALPVFSTTATTTSQVGQYPITGSGAVDPNYNITYVQGTLTVTAITLTFNPIPATTYGSSDFNPGATSTSAITYTSSNTAVATIVAGKIHIIGAGTSTITASNGSGSSTQTLTVTPVPLTITAANQTKAYGAANPTLTVTYTGFVNGDTKTSLNTQPIVTTTATTTSAAGTYPITPRGAVDANYTITYVAGTLTVTSVPLVFAAIPSKVYGTANFSPGATSTAAITYTSSNTAVATIVSGNIHIVAVGTSTITASNGSTSLTQTLTVTPAALTIAAVNQTKVYGAANPAFTVTYTGFVNGDTQAKLTTQPAVTTTALISSPVGTYPVTASGAVGANYTITYTAATLTIGTAPLAIAAVNQAKTYGAANPTLTASYTGFVNGDTQANLTTQPAITTTALTSSPVGAYPVTATGAADANYTITYTAGTLTVGTAPLTIAAANQAKTYGAANPTLTATLTGFVNGDTQASLTTQPTITTTALASSPVGTYPITAAGAVDANYTITYTAATLTVGTAPLTITAVNKTKTAGSANPALTVTYTGLVNGDTQASLTTQPTVITTATTSSVAGTYPITASGAVDANYAITYVAGTLTVTGSSLIFAAIPSKVYGTANFSPGATSTAAITYTSSNTAVATIVSGNIHIVAVGTSTITANNGSTSLTQTLTVTPAALTIAAVNQTKVYGAANPAFTVTYTGFVNGDTQAKLTTLPAVTTTALISSPVGTYPVTAIGAVDANYTITYTAGTLTIGTAPLTITAVNQTTIYGTAATAFAVTYTGFVNGDTQAVLTTLPAVTSTAIASSNAGTYPITAAGAVDANYTITYQAGTLTIGPAPLTIQGATSTLTYGSPIPSIALTSGFHTGPNQSGTLTTQPVGTTTATASSPVGTYPVTISGASSPNYTISYIPGSIIITPAPLTITAVNQTKSAGSANPTLTVTYTGFEGSDTQASLTTQPTVTTTATTTSAAGTYPITASGAADANYAITYVAGTLTVTQVSLAFAAIPAEVYGTANFSPGATGTGTITYTSSNTAVATIVSGNIHIIGVGTSTITAKNSTTTLSQLLTVTAAPLTITAANQTTVYGNAAAAFTVSYTGFVNGNTKAVVTTLPTITSTATASSNAGTYPITASGAVAANYTITYVAGTLTIGPAPLTIQGATSTLTYGSPIPSIALTSGFHTGPNQSGTLTTEPVGTTTATASSPVGTYPVTISGASSPNYTISYIAGSIIITPAPLTITANNQAKTAGTANPTLTITYTGFEGSDTQASLTTQPTVTTTATTASAAGIYPIKASGAADANYKITYVAGTLTVTPLVAGAPVISYASPQSYTVNTAIAALIPASTGGAVLPAYYAKTTQFYSTITGSGLTTDPQGNIYVSISYANIIMKITPAGAVTSFAGTGSSGSTNGAGATATFNYPVGLASDASGNIYVADYQNALIRKITPAGLVSTFYATGTNTYPTSLAVDKAGNVYVTINPGSIEKITPGGVKTTISSAFVTPYGVAVNSAGTIIYVTDASNRIFTLTPAGVVTVLAGSGTQGAANGKGPAASFYNPSNISLDALGNIYVDDSGNNMVRLVSPAGVVTTLAGSGAKSNISGIGTAASFIYAATSAIDPTGNYLYVTGYGIQKVNITGYTISPALPQGLAIDSTGTVKGTPTTGIGATSYQVTAYNPAGNGSANITMTINGGALTFAAIPAKVYGTANFSPGAVSAGLVTYTSSNTAVATIVAGNINITGVGKSTITANNGTNTATQTLTVTAAALTITANNLTKVAGFGNPTLTASYTGLVNGDTQASLTTQPTLTTTATISSAVGSYTITASGAVDANYTIKYVAGKLTVTAVVAGVPAISYATPQLYTVNTAIAPLSPASTGGTVPLGLYGKTVVYAGQNGVAGSANGSATAATFSNLEGAAADPQGNVYVADAGNNLIRKITPAGVVTTFAGSGMAGAADGTGTAASFSFPGGLASDASGNIYVADAGNGHAREITSAGAVTTLAPTFSALFYPAAIAVDKADNVYIASSGEGGIYKITAGRVVTVIGTPLEPWGVAVNSAGTKLYVADDFTNSIFTGTTAGVSTLLAGSDVPDTIGGGYTSGTGSANGAGTAARFFGPNNISLDAIGNVYVNDSENNMVRVINPAGVVTTLAGSGVAGAANGIGTAATLNFPFGSAIDPTGNYLYVANSSSSVVQKINITGYSISPALPPGLAIDSTGTISGTPTAVSPATTYTVTAYNKYGSITTNISITVQTATAGFAVIPPKVYGNADFKPGAVSAAAITYTSSTPGVATIVSGNIHIVGAGTSIITAVTNGDTLSRILTVNKAPLTVAINNQVKITGAANPEFTMHYTGFVKGEAPDVLTTEPTVSTPASVFSPAGTYPITAGGGEALNYSFTYTDGALTVSNANVARSGALLTDSVPGAWGEPKVNPAVSPNGDGHNDVLTIANIEQYPENKLELMNLNGAKIFEAVNYDNINHAFDGHSTVNGKMQLPGTYFYRLQYKANGELKSKTGYIVLKY